MLVRAVTNDKLRALFFAALIGSVFLSVSRENAHSVLFARQCFAKKLLQIVLSQRANLSAGKSARPALFVVNPNVQAVFFTFRDGGFKRADPFFPQIFHGKSRAGVQMKPAYAAAGKFTDFSAYILVGHVAVPRPENGRLKICIVHHILYSCINVAKRFMAYMRIRKSLGWLMLFASISAGFLF